MPKGKPYHDMSLYELDRAYTELVRKAAEPMSLEAREALRDMRSDIRAERFRRTHPELFPG